MWTHFIMILALLLPFAAPGQAQQMPTLPVALRPAFQAVGVVNHQGLNGPAACSGVLVAANKVLTAAHCVWGDGPRYFIPGGVNSNLGSFQARHISIHPDYTKLADPMARYDVDLAIMTLKTPVAVPAIAPKTPTKSNETYAMVGFSRGGAAVPVGQLDCRVLDHPKWLVLGCPVVSGNSGGPVINTMDQEKSVIGIAVAKLGGSSMVAQVDDWVLREVAKDP